MAVFLFSPAAVHCQVKKCRSAGNAVSEDFLAKGDKAAAQGWRTDALALYNKAIAQDPANAQAYVMRATLAHRMGGGYASSFPGVIADYSKAIKADPACEVAYSNRGGLYFVMEKNEKALADFARAIKLDPHDESIYENRQQIYVKQGKYDLALADIDKMIEFAGDEESRIRNTRLRREVAAMKSGKPKAEADKAEGQVEPAADEPVVTDPVGGFVSDYVRSVEDMGAARPPAEPAGKIAPLNQ